MIQLAAIAEQQNGPEVHINCPACGADNVTASSFELTELLKLFFIIPILRLRNTWLVCDSCTQKLPISCSLIDLNYLSADLLSVHIRYGVSVVAKVMAVLGLVTCLFPFVGAVFAGIACFLTRGTKGWPKNVSVLSFVLALTITIAIVVVGLID